MIGKMLLNKWKHEMKHEHFIAPGMCVLYNCTTGIAHCLCKKKEIKSYNNRNFEFCHQPLGRWFLEAKTVTVSSLNINFQRCNALMGEKKIEKGFALKSPN